MRTFGLDSRQAIKTLIWKGLSCYLQDISEMFLEFRHTKASKKEFMTMRVFSKRNLACFLAIALTFSQFGSVAQAVDIVDVTSLPPDNASDQQHDIKEKLWYANAFRIEGTTSEGAAFDTIFLALDPSDKPSPPSIDKASALDVRVYGSDTNGDVDYTTTGLKGNFVYNPSVTYPGSVANVAYRYDKTELVLPNAKYWVFVSTNEKLDDYKSEKVSWFKKSQKTDEVGEFASILPDIKEYNVTTGKWSSVNEGNQMFRFAINNPVPEPSTYVLGAVMTGVLAFVNRYQARQKMAVKPSA